MNEAELDQGGPDVGSAKIRRRRARLLIGGGIAALILAAVVVIVVVSQPGPPPAGLKTGGPVPCPGADGSNCVPGDNGLAKTMQRLGKDYKCYREDHFDDNNYTSVQVACDDMAQIAANEPYLPFSFDNPFSADLSVGFQAPNIYGMDGSVGGFFAQGAVTKGSESAPTFKSDFDFVHGICAATARVFRATADAVFADYPHVRSDMNRWLVNHITECVDHPEESTLESGVVDGYRVTLVFPTRLMVTLTAQAAEISVVPMS